MKQEITLEQAQAIVDAHREAERAAKIKTARTLIGRCYKYRNSYGVGGPHEKWWLYAIATNVDALGLLVGASFQHTSNDTIEIDPKARIYVEHGWTEIKPAEFWEAAAQIRTEVRHRLSKKRRTKKRLRPLSAIGGKRA